MREDTGLGEGFERKLDSEGDRGVGGVRGGIRKESSVSETSEPLAEIDLWTRFGDARVAVLEVEQGLEVGTESAPAEEAVCGRFG